MEINGQWIQQREAKAKDGRSGHWWEHGYIRRLEVPEDADWKKIEAHLNNDIFLELRIPKNNIDGDVDDNIAKNFMALRWS